MSNVWKKEDKLSRSSTTRVKHVKHVYFVTKYKPKKGSASLNQNQAKKLDSSIIPPCSKVLHQKIKRCIYVASIWTNSLRMKPTPYFPPSFGWTLDEDGTFCIKRFEGDVAQSLLKWLRTILALVMVSFSVLKYKYTYTK